MQDDKTHTTYLGPNPFRVMGWNDALEQAAKIARKFPKANRQDLFEDIEKSILALRIET